MKNTINKFKTSILALVLTFACFGAMGQTEGDYRTNVTGTWNWITAANWEVYNGTSWETATKYPGQDAESETVTILSGATVLLNGSEAYYRIKNLTIEGDLQLTADESVSLTTGIELNGGTISITSGTLTIAGSLDITSGDINISSGANLTIRGDFSKTGGTI